MGTLAATGGFSIVLGMNYLVDTYHEIAGDAMTSIILIRNTMSFAISYG